MKKTAIFTKFLFFFHQWDGVLGLWSYKRDDYDDADAKETKESLSKNTRCSARMTIKNRLGSL